MPGSGLCVALTDPLCGPRPESGSCAAEVPEEDPAGGPNCASKGEAMRMMTMK